jgi:hypothetical protein
MRKLLLWTAPLLATLLWGCSGGGGGGSTGGLTGTTGAGDAGGGTTGAFNIADLDLKDGGLGPNGYVAAALAPDGRVGVAYYWNLDSAHRRIEYLEVQTDNSTRGVTLADSVSRTSQLGVTFDDGGNAYVAYFGNDPDLSEAIETVGGDGGQFWFESDLAVAKIDPQLSLTTEYPATNGFDYTACGNPVSDRDSPVVGYSPAIAMNGDELVIVHRNLHSGQFPLQDYGKSDFDGTVGTPGNWSSSAAICGSDEGGLFVSQGLGQDSSIATLNGKAVVVTGGQTDLTSTVRSLFTVQYENGAWGNKQAVFGNASPPLAPNDGTGPRIASDSTAGFGLAWTDYTSSIVYYANSPDGLAWSGHESVFGAGTGGWYPTIAFDPTIHQPVVAYYFCSQDSGVSPGNCQPNQDELRVSRRRTNATWEPITVDAEGGFYPTLLFNGGQMVLVYRTPAGGLRIARQVAQ